MKKVILASASKRRSEILTSCGISHMVMPSGVPETADVHISDAVVKNAVKKAEFIAEKEKNAIIISADTLVAHDNKAIGKPADADEARCMLKSFSGAELEVYTGLCVIDMPSGKKASTVDISDLRVVEMSDEEIEKYFPLLGPYDKAGGFSIEGVGAMLFDDIEGSYFNILGLSMVSLRRLFLEIGLDIADFVHIGE
ncbi:MAG TPA: nucleoside triphosphate pyrophosphatase [Candidatus Omnitrophota bacterium]|nr:nucleoside triphosphate pyrophosphatase [Candidatus Omnitrophota bacterium]HPS20998.1 nucleoside triphosphate pyrophosphatase [Candidatus Omnitrophota bacterium]